MARAKKPTFEELTANRKEINKNLEQKKYQMKQYITNNSYLTKEEMDELTAKDKKLYKTAVAELEKEKQWTEEPDTEYQIQGCLWVIIMGIIFIIINSINNDFMFWGFGIIILGFWIIISQPSKERKKEQLREKYSSQNNKSVEQKDEQTKETTTTITKEYSYRKQNINKYL